MVTLLVIILLLTGALGYQAWDASRSLDEVATASVREQALFGASTFLRQVRRDVAFDLLQQGIDLFDSDRPLEMGWIRRAAGQREWLGAGHARVFFRFEFPSRAVEVVGAEDDPAFVAWALTELAERVEDREHHRDEHVIFPETGDEVLVYYMSLRRSGETVAFGYALSFEGFHGAFDDAFDDEPLLPEALTGGSTNREIFTARVLGPGDRVVYASVPEPQPGVMVNQPLDRQLGGMVLELSVRPEAEAVLVSGGLPESRLPVIFVLLSMTAGLLVMAILQLRHEAELAQLRQDFVSGVSHELRTPLAQIRMFGETLLLGRVRNDGERKRSLEIIVGEAQRLTHQVDNVLVFSRGARDGLSLNILETDLSALVHDAIEGFEPLAEAVGVELRREIEDDIGCPVDEETVRQALLNLIDNAVKYGPSGQTVTIGLSDRPGEGVVLWVEDEGPGVPDDHRERIWDPYYRLERDRASATAGSGIGLSVVREVVETHGGSVRVEQARGTDRTGARFVIELPSAIAVA